MYVGVKIKGREGAFYKTVSNNVTEVKLICEKNWRPVRPDACCTPYPSDSTATGSTP